MDNQIRQYLSNANIDVDTGLARCAGNEQLYLRLLGMFAADSSHAAFREAMDRGNLEEAERASHAMKGSCGNLSMDGLYKAVTELNTALKRNDAAGVPKETWPPDPDALARLAQQMEEEYARVQETIAQLENLR